MSDAPSQASQRSHLEVLDAFSAHSSGTRTDTKSATLNIIRRAYPGHHVTEVDGNSCSLLDFAEAGKAELKFSGEGEREHEKDYFYDEVYGKIWKGDEKKVGPFEDAGEQRGSEKEKDVGKVDLRSVFDATREWTPVGSGVEKKMHPGQLNDNYRFVHFQYTWEAKTYIVYHISYKEPFVPATHTFYILYPRRDTMHPHTLPRHCHETDNLILACSKWTAQLHSEIWVFDNGSWRKSRSLWESISGSNWDDVILDPAMKEGLIEDVQGFFDNRDLYATYAVPWKRGIILHGVPGNGKTVSIKALINNLSQRDDQVSSLYIKSFETSCNTEQYSIRLIFSHARRCSPCLLIFEDLDSLVDDNIRSYFLNEVDGLESNDGILMIGSTNHLDRLDPAIAKRPSRFDRKYHFKLPGEMERKLYAEYWRNKLLAKNEELQFPEDLCGIIATLTEGFSFAYLKELFVMSLLSLVRGFKGEDFEIVDEHEAASAPGDEEEQPSSSSSHKDKEKEETLCTCATKCNTCGKPVSSTATAPELPSSDLAAKSTSSSAMPYVEVPEHLADNILLKVIKHQIRVLHAEMDNTKTEEWPSGKKQLGEMDPGSAMQRRNLNRQRGKKGGCC